MRKVAVDLISSELDNHLLIEAIFENILKDLIEKPFKS